MASILDNPTAVYPWPDPVAQQLHVTLFQLYPVAKNANLVGRQAGVDIYMVDFEQPPAYLWKDLLEEATREGRLRDLVNVARDRAAATSPSRPFLQDLLDNVTPPVQEPRGLDGAPNFLAKSDEITEQEALLYYDDLTIQIGRVPGMVTTLQRLVQLAPSVCKLSVDVFGALKEGTGFRIGPDMLLTNWHVFHLRDNTRASAVTAEFGYEDDGKGKPRTSQGIQCDVTTIQGSEADDWAVIKASEPLKSDAEWPVIKLSQAAVPEERGFAYIIQHPGGGRKRLGFVRNQISYIDNRVVQYLTDTQEGSSGAPVFNELGQLIALHHAGGRPQDVLGRAPTKKNEGIRISAVATGMQALGIAVV